MKAPAKYAICIIVGVVVEIVGLGLLFLAIFGFETTVPPAPFISFVFPSVCILAPYGHAEGFVSGLLMCIVPLQMPFYGWILAREWVRHRLLRAMLALACFHLLAGGIGFEMATKAATFPLKGWKQTGSIGLAGGENLAPLPVSITDDYQDFIKKLPIRKDPFGFGDRSYSYWIDMVSSWEDGTGQQAIDIEIQLDEAWHYALIYDKNNRRIKVIRYYFRGTRRGF
jgi:hypothetical protein